MREKLKLRDNGEDECSYINILKLMEETFVFSLAEKTFLFHGNSVKFFTYHFFFSQIENILKAQSPSDTGPKPKTHTKTTKAQTIQRA